MMHTLKPYPKYRESGVPWLSTIPSDWDVRRLKHLFRERDERSARGQERLLSLRMNEGLVDHLDVGGTPVSPDALIGYKRVRPGQVVMNRMRATSGLFAVATRPGIVSPDYAVFDPQSRVDAWYFVRLFKTPIMGGVFRLESKGLGTGEAGFLRLYTDRFGRIPVPVPEAGEQSAIVRFLDHADRRIRRYIRAKKKLIALLNEQKQAIIHRAVTRGLDPTVRLKPSGVEWLGDVPAHWSMKRLKTLVRRVDQGVSPQAENYLAEEGAWGVLKAGCVNNGLFRDTEHKRLPTGFRFDPALAIEIGDVLVSRASGSPRFVGSVARVSSLAYRLILSDKTFRLVVKEDVEPEFMVLAMNSPYYRRQVEAAISGAEGLANNLPLGALRAFLFAVPPRKEQRNVVEHIRDAVLAVDRGTQQLQREVGLLLEYRTRLIADVVTGKVDVRELAAQLPDEPEELPEEAEAVADGEDVTQDEELVAAAAELQDED